MTATEHFPHPMVVLNPGTPADDRYGNPAPGADTPSSPVFGWLAQRGTSEVLDGRTAVVTQTVLRLPLGTPVGPQSRIRDERDGKVYEVDGEVYEVPGRNGPDHLRLLLNRVAG